ncbi:glycosyltransferase [Nesterenkonia halotolerans]|uniref:glycosyltransferase n=1 Tax=Nesterenkonia halotolerans TaxID=225325 RepID=UPI003EE62D37
MRWIDLHPSASSSDFDESNARSVEGDESILSAAFATHRAALNATELAHRAAARAWQSTDKTSLAAVLRDQAAATHLTRADSYRGKSALLCAKPETSSRGDVRPTAQDLEKVAPERGGAQGFLGSPRRVLEEAFEASSGLPAGEAGVSRPSLPVRVGLIADASLEAGFHGAAELASITAENWAENLGDLDLLIIGSETSVPFETLADVIVPAFRERSVPVVFFSAAAAGDVEAHFDIAEACDRIFTVDQRAAEAYREMLLEPSSVEAARMPVSPLLHSPVGTRPARTDAVAFFGLDQSRNTRHVPAAETVTALFDGALASGRPVAFFQRGSAEGRPGGTWSVPSDYAPWTVFPREVQQLASRDDLCRLQRGTDVGIAVNQVVGSQTLVDSQVLQLQASGTMVLSSYNQGVNSYYPNVYIANSAEDVAKTLQYLGADELRRIQGDGIRTVFAQHHGADVLSSICRAVGISVPEVEERVLVVTEELTEELASDIRDQTLTTVGVTTWTDLHRWKPATATTPGDYDILLPVGPSRRYSPFYAEDHVAAFRYQASPVTSKLDGSVEETDEFAHQVGRHVEDLELTAWWRPSAEILGTPRALAGALLERSVYTIDHLGHRPRDTRRTVNPTSGSDFEASKREFHRTAESLGLELAVVVPIYNNGDHLRHKAFASLLRSEMFDRMHILLINDGSTDASTRDTVEELAQHHPNVSAFHHAAGGSGSASRPRNTGLALSFTEFVTYLDPDDEELDDGYMELLEALRDQPRADFALGTMAVWTHRYTVFDYHAWFQPGVDHHEGLNWPRPDTLRTLNFRPASIEALVARTEWLKSLGLVQPVGAVGQDTYFFQQLMYYATAYVPVYRPVYTYYGAVDTSVMNVVSPKYFRKYLILETARATWLREVGLLEAYKDQRFEAFFVSWYLEKFEKVQADQREEALEILHQIAHAYGSYEWTSPRARAFFNKHPEQPQAQLS